MELRSALRADLLPEEEPPFAHISRMFFCSAKVSMFECLQFCTPRTCSSFVLPGLQAIHTVHPGALLDACHEVEVAMLLSQDKSFWTNSLLVTCHS